MSRCPTCGAEVDLIRPAQARLIRRASGMTLREMAAWGDLHHTYLSKLERGRLRMSIPASQLYERLAQRNVRHG